MCYANNNNKGYTPYSPHFTGSRLSSTGFVVDDGVTSRYNSSPERKSSFSLTTKNNSRPLPSGVFGDKVFNSSRNFSLVTETHRSGNIFSPNYRAKGNVSPALKPPVTKFKAQKQSDGSYLGPLTSRVNKETGQREFGRTTFSGRPDGNYGLFKDGSIGIPSKNNFQPLNESYRKSDTRHIKTQPSSAKQSLRVGSSTRSTRKGTSGLTVSIGTGTGSGINVPQG